MSCSAQMTMHSYASCKILRGSLVRSNRPGGPMHRALRRIPFALACAASLVAACSRREKAGDSARVADSTAVATPAAPAVTPAAPALTDANIFALLDEANAADSAAGSIAAVKGTSPDVKAFGRQMMRDHHALRV